MSIHLTPHELATEHGLPRRDVIKACIERGVPIYQGRIDKTLFEAEVLRAADGDVEQESTGRFSRNQSPARRRISDAHEQPASAEVS